MAADEILTKYLIRLQALCVAMRRSRSNQASAMFVREYEDILRQLADAGVDVSGFEIPDEAIPGLEDGYRNCDRDFFDMRLAALMVHISTRIGKGAHPDPASVERIMYALDAWKDDDVPF